jgi:hypothetical protein
LAGAAGAAIELSRVEIYLSKQRLILRKTLKENLVSYLSYAKKELESAETGDAIDLGGEPGIML